ncbi:phage terminase large subunit [Halalkalibacterium halodurans]|uniref:phage terminase large subunit n=1 Tax=Halalkalibacterium halodurans TaxID=86665 RepID=UPI002E1E7DBE|nr:phage terminase large subunit [Halalkalibacterium halodurans]
MSKQGSGFLAPREERVELQRLLTEELSLLIELIESGKAEPSHYDRFKEVDEELTQIKRINRAEYDVAYFAVEYFSEECNPDNDGNLIPEGVTYDTMSEFHIELCGLLSDIASGRQRQNVAWACPRQHAKTAYGSNIFPIHQIVYKHAEFIMVVSETTDSAGTFITWGNRQLKFNEKLRKDFGVLLNERATQNELDNKYEYITANGVKVVAKGANTQIRGARHGNKRPQVIILDDLEGKENVSTPDQMRKTRAWFDEELLPAMAKDGICLYLGTILCYDSLLDYVIRERRDFESRKYAAIMQFAERSDLWSKWREIYLSDSPTARMKAMEFYENNEDEMLKGVKLLWGEYWTYIDLIEKLTNMGAKSFNQEYQNEPTDEERQIFKPENMFYYTEFDMRNKPFEYYAGVDFAMGKERGDFSAIVTIAKNKNTGICYVVDVYLRRVHPDVFMKDIIEKTINFQYDRIAVEAQMAQDWFADQLRDRLAVRGYPAHTRLTKVKQRSRKELRIEALLPEIQSGKIRFSKKHTDLLDQLALYPMHKHDDGPDALEMAYRAAQAGTSGIVQVAQVSRRW